MTKRSLDLQTKFSECELLALEDLLVVDLDWLKKERPVNYSKVMKYGWSLFKRMCKEEDRSDKIKITNKKYRIGAIEDGKI